MAEEYHNVLVITIAHEDVEECTFSADTSIAECLVIARRGERKNTGIGTFVCLNRCPNGELDALELAKKNSQFQGYPTSEDGTGGNPIRVGEETIGYIISAPLFQVRPGGPYLVLKIWGRAISTLSREWLIRLPRQISAIQIPVCSVSEIAALGAGTKDICGGAGRVLLTLKKDVLTPPNIQVCGM